MLIHICRFTKTDINQNKRQILITTIQNVKNKRVCVPIKITATIN